MSDRASADEAPAHPRVARYNPLYLNRAGTLAAYIRGPSVFGLDLLTAGVTRWQIGHGELASALAVDGGRLVVAGADIVSVVAFAPRPCGLDVRLVVRVASPEWPVRVFFDDDGETGFLGRQPDATGTLWWLAGDRFRALAPTAALFPHEAELISVAASRADGAAVVLGRSAAPENRPLLRSCVIGHRGEVERRWTEQDLAFPPLEMVGPWPGGGVGIVGAGGLAIHDWPRHGQGIGPARASYPLATTHPVAVSPGGRLVAWLQPPEDGSAHAVFAVARIGPEWSSSPIDQVPVGSLPEQPTFAVDDEGTVTVVGLDPHDDDDGGGERVRIVRHPLHASGPLIDQIVSCSAE